VIAEPASILIAPIFGYHDPEGAKTTRSTLLFFVRLDVPE
jgi:hypothetical protein